MGAAGHLLDPIHISAIRRGFTGTSTAVQRLLGFRVMDRVETLLANRRWHPTAVLAISTRFRS
jgi:hypothetical protein